MEKAAWEDDHWCYVCGTENPEGMKLGFTVKGREIETTYRAEKRHQGYRDVLHGGFLAMLMDEVIVHLPWKVLGTWSVTAEMKVRLLKPVPVGETVRVRAFFLDPNADAGSRMFRVGAECLAADGTVVARAEGKCVRIS